MRGTVKCLEKSLSKGVNRHLSTAMGVDVKNFVSPARMKTVFICGAQDFLTSCCLVVINVAVAIEVGTLDRCRTGTRSAVEIDEPATPTTRRAVSPSQSSPEPDSQGGPVVLLVECYHL